MTNNVVITSACWGIGFGSLHNSRIVNNTVVDDGLIAEPGCAASVWVTDKTHEGSSTSSTMVRNNIANRIWVYNVGYSVEADHNIAMCCSGPELTWYVSGDPVYFGKPGTYTNGNIIDSAGPMGEFANFNPATLTYDVLLKSTAQAICAGTATGAPTFDIVGVARSAPGICARTATGAYAVPVGAYAYPF